ncbi:phosphoribosylanthranilate isomerase [Granulicella sp. dw_53]|uniref:phosphoribosylanthranilate isomerase n=1 Tax=Granulicella sp. dw_53 TaxID=2719792 RepID=UPI001BD2C3ED|nr:phosphoribosylanthranilate isomerase [Granulicella sp. dw_53]
MWIKICANTNLEDAKLAAELGADTLGFVFAASPRRVTAGQVAAIVAHLPVEVEKIGVFDTLDVEKISDTIREAGLTGVQLHGGFSTSLIDALASGFPGLRIIQTTHWNVDASTNDPSCAANLTALRSHPEIDAVLVDSRTAKASGGTGVVFDWEAARVALSGLAPMRLIVAGGLQHENVEEAIKVLQPWGVDVASGVESHPGRKDRERLAAFLANARKVKV